MAGCGKSQLIGGLLKEIKALKPDDFYSSKINFNYYTNAASLQNTMEMELIK